MQKSSSTNQINCPWSHVKKSSKQNKRSKSMRLTKQDLHKTDVRKKGMEEKKHSRWDKFKGKHVKHFTKLNL